MAAVALIVGLGNPGAQYAGSRHNAGFEFLAQACAQHGASLRPERRFHGAVGRITVHGRDARLLQPDTFMNHSGRAVQALAAFYRIPAQQMLVVHDELDLPPGTARLKFGGGHGGHNGLRSVTSELGTPEFMRLRLGIGHPGASHLVTPYVLSRAPGDEVQALDSAIRAALAVLPLLLQGDMEGAMQRLHTVAPPPGAA